MSLYVLVQVHADTVGVTGTGTYFEVSRFLGSQSRVLKRCAPASLAHINQIRDGHVGVWLPRSQ
jgi:hypothetical protein